MDRQMIEGMLGDALEREIITAKTVDGAYPPAVAVGILDGPGREIGFGHGESQLTVILPDIGDCALRRLMQGPRRQGAVGNLWR